MQPRPNLIIHSGPEANRELTVAPGNGSRVGRSSRNDIVLQDEKASRFHCRFFFKPGEGLFVADLGSSNETHVNNRAIREVRLHVGDLVALGDTVLKVVDDGGTPTPTSAAAVDLGLAQPAAAPTAGKRPPHRGMLITVALVVILIAIAAWLPSILRSSAPPAAASNTPPPPAALDIDYEKVLADTNRIFRYHFALGPDRRLTVNIDDTEKTHLREEGVIKETQVQELIQTIESAGFFELVEQYEGLQPDVFEQYDLRVTLGARTRRCRVLNREEPAGFKSVRESLENFAQIELGLWAIQYPPDKLVDMAQAAYLQAKKLYDERDVDHGNLANAIMRMKDAKFYLNTIDPKPDFYGDLAARLAEYSAELDQRYIDQNFLANRAVRAKEWDQAAVELRTLCEILGDRADPRYSEARAKLLEVESRISVGPK